LNKLQSINSFIALERRPKVSILSISVSYLIKLQSINLSIALGGDRRFLFSALTLCFLNIQGEFQFISKNITDIGRVDIWNLTSLYWHLRLISSLFYLIRSYYSCYFLVEFCIEVLLEVFILSIMLFDFERNCYSNCLKEGLYHHAKPVDSA
jgi:hypothetical protein